MRVSFNGESYVHNDPPHSRDHPTPTRPHTPATPPHPPPALQAVDEDTPQATGASAIPLVENKSSRSDQMVEDEGVGDYAQNEGVGIGEISLYHTVVLPFVVSDQEGGGQRRERRGLTPKR